MSKNLFFTSEFVSPGHPDKICDQISDAVLDACLVDDPQSRVACEFFATTGLVMVGGEITTNTYIDIQKIIREKIEEIGLSQREISKRLGKNASYLAGVFRTGLSTAKQAELLEKLEVVGGGGTVHSDDEIIAELSQKLADCQNAGIKALESYGIVQKQLTQTQKYLMVANQNCEVFETKYRKIALLNWALCTALVVVLILWVLA